MSCGRDTLIQETIGFVRAAVNKECRGKLATNTHQWKRSIDRQWTPGTQYCSWWRFDLSASLSEDYTPRTVNLTITNPRRFTDDAVDNDIVRRQCGLISSSPAAPGYHRVASRQSLSWFSTLRTSAHPSLTGACATDLCSRWPERPPNAVRMMAWRADIGLELTTRQFDSEVYDWLTVAATGSTRCSS